MVASKINLQELQTTQVKINKPRNKKWIPNLSFHGGSWVCMPHAFSDVYPLLWCSLFFSRWCVGEVKWKPIVLEVSVQWLYVSTADLFTVKVKWTMKSMITGIHECKDWRHTGIYLKYRGKFLHYLKMLYVTALKEYKAYWICRMLTVYLKLSAAQLHSPQDRQICRLSEQQGQSHTSL